MAREEVRLRVERGLIFARLHVNVSSIGQKQAGFDVVFRVTQKALNQPPFQLRRFDGEQRLHSPIQITLHHIRATEQNLLFALTAVLEVIDSMVLEEAADDTDRADVLAQPRDSRRKAAAPANDKVDLHPGLARVVKQIRRLEVGQ
jgi:hypothetical protein